MHPAGTRHFATLGITAAAAALALVTAAPALADPPPGHGNGGSNGNAPSQPPGQAKQSPTPTQTSPSTKTSPANNKPTPTSTHVAPGQAKKSTKAPKANNGKAKGAGKGHSNGNANPNSNSNGHGKGNGGGKGANGPAGHNPPGNNGTVKIHAVAGDAGHHNVPHPGCNFVVDFWGFDAGQTLTVSFTGQAPTGAGTPLTLSGSGTSVTSPDDAGGGNDPDGELTFTPTASELSVLGAPAHQGYHIRLTVDTGQGGGHKYKVFWLSPCASTTPANTPVPTGTPTLSTDTPAVHTLSKGVAVTHRGAVFTDTPELDSAQVTSSRPRQDQASPLLASLPFTGANLSTLIASGILALAAGTVITVAARRRRKIG